MLKQIIDVVRTVKRFGLIFFCFGASTNLEFSLLSGSGTMATLGSTVVWLAGLFGLFQELPRGIHNH